MRSSPRRRAGALLVLAALVFSSFTAVPSPGWSAPSDTVADKQAEAERIARQLEQQGRQVSILAEDYDEARVKIESLEVELSAAVAVVAKTDAKATAIRRRLTKQSVESYMRGGSAPALALLANTDSTEDLAVRSHYVRTITSGAADALDELREVRQELDVQRGRLDEAREEARAAASLAESKRREAAAAEAAQRQTLRQVQGELASLIEAETKRRAEEEARRAQAELASRKARAEEAAREAAARQAAALDAARRAAAATTTTVPRPSGGSAAVVTTRPPTSTTSTTVPRSTSTTMPAVGSGGGSPAAGADAAIAEARRQLGKPYEWGGSGPDTFDCSGLTSWAWRAGGKRLSHSSRAQWTETSRVSIENAQPGDLLFYGEPIHHVGLYIGNGEMIEAPETGKNVRIASIYRRDMVGVGRVN